MYTSTFETVALAPVHRSLFQPRSCRSMVEPGTRTYGKDYECTDRLFSNVLFVFPHASRPARAKAVKRPKLAHGVAYRVAYPCLTVSLVKLSKSR